MGVAPLKPPELSNALDGGGAAIARTQATAHDAHDNSPTNTQLIRHATPRLAPSAVPYAHNHRCAATPTEQTSMQQSLSGLPPLSLLDDAVQGTYPRQRPWRVAEAPRARSVVPCRRSQTRPAARRRTSRRTSYYHPPALASCCPRPAAHAARRRATAAATGTGPKTPHRHLTRWATARLTSASHRRPIGLRSTTVSRPIYCCDGRWRVAPLTHAWAWLVLERQQGHHSPAPLPQALSRQHRRRVERLWAVHWALQWVWETPLQAHDCHPARAQGATTSPPTCAVKE